MAVLITGALGHIGMWVSARLVEEGEEVIAFDRSASAFDQVAPEELLRNRERIRLEGGDVNDPAVVDALFAKYTGDIDGVIHIASAAGVPEFVVHPREYIGLNVMGAVHVLEAARTHGVRKVVFISSGAVYGARAGTLHESDPCEPGDLYGASKLAGEQLTLQYGDTYGMETTCVRVYFVYGPGKRPAAMFPIYQLAFGPLDGMTGLVSDKGADQVLDFTHVFDTAQGIVKIYRQSPPKSRVYNVSSGVAVRLADLAEIVRDYVGNIGTDMGVRLGPGNLVKRGAPLDVTRAVEEVGYAPQFTDIRDGIRQYAEWLQRTRAR